jgi:hypothetical protein
MGMKPVSADDTRRIIKEQINTYTSEKVSALEVAITKLGDQQDRTIRLDDPASAVTARNAFNNATAVPLVRIAYYGLKALYCTMFFIHSDFHVSTLM